MPDTQNQLPAQKKKAGCKKNHLSKNKTVLRRGGFILSRLPEGKIKNFIFRYIQKRRALVKLRKEGKPIPVPYYTKPHICRNCKARFTGKYCYNCGQSARVTRLNFSSVLDNLLDGMTNVARGSFFTILNLFTRPGYMINDYIKGKRIIFAKPFQMLFVLAAIYALCSQLKHPGDAGNDPDTAAGTAVRSPAASGTENISPDAQTKDKTFQNAFPVPTGPPSAQNPGIPAEEKNEEPGSELSNRIKNRVSGLSNRIEKQVKEKAREEKKTKTDRTGPEEGTEEDEEELKEILKLGKSKLNENFQQSPFLAAVLDLLAKWFHSNRALQEILIIPFTALGLKWAFRKSKYNGRLNFIEYSFIAAFLSCQALIISLFLLLFNIQGSGIIIWARIICMYWVCKELFRNGYMKTLWRLVLSGIYMILAIILFATIIILIIVIIYGIYQASLPEPGAV